MPPPLRIGVEKEATIKIIKINTKKKSCLKHLNLNAVQFCENCSKSFLYCNKSNKNNLLLKYNPQYFNQNNFKTF